MVESRSHAMLFCCSVFLAAAAAFSTRPITVLFFFVLRFSSVLYVYIYFPAVEQLDFRVALQLN
jgi:hypothetical protein